MRASTSAPPLPLPRIGGPKLDPFSGTATADIYFIHFAGGEDDVDSIVWKVSINGKHYALKIFPFQYWEGLMETSGQYIITRDGERPLTPQEYVNYLDPFNNECRVYGRLKQAKRDDIAVRAHGYILLTPKQEQEVTEAHGGQYRDPRIQNGLASNEMDEDNAWQRCGCHRNELVRAIVKDFVVEGTPDFEKSQILQMYEDMETLYSLGILIRDIHPGNYLSGKLVDFSCSWTMYHPCLDRISQRDLRELRLDDPIWFNNMIVSWCNLHNTDILLPKALEEWSGGIEDCGINPCDYDWRKWEDGEDGEDGEDDVDGEDVNAESNGI